MYFISTCLAGGFIMATAIRAYMGNSIILTLFMAGFCLFMSGIGQARAYEKK